MPRDAFVLKIQRELCHPKYARKVSGLSRNRPLDPQWTQWITRSAFRISLRPDWLLPVESTGQFIARTQILVHRARHTALLCDVNNRGLITVRAQRRRTVLVKEITARAKMSLRRAQNIFIPANINFTFLLPWRWFDPAACSAYQFRYPCQLPLILSSQQCRPLDCKEGKINA